MKIYPKSRNQLVEPLWFHSDHPDLPFILPLM